MSIIDQARKALALIAQGRAALTEVAAAVQDGRAALSETGQADLNRMLAEELTASRAAHDSFDAALTRASNR